MSDTLKNLEENGIIYGLAKACVETAREIADKSTPKGYIEEATRLIRDDNPDAVAHCLQRILTGLQILSGKATNTVKVDLL